MVAVRSGTGNGKDFHMRSRDYMTDPIWQAERKKIMTRLSIAIYKMTDEQLIALLHLFKGLEFKNKVKLLELPKVDTDRIDRPRERQLLIAHFFLLINKLSEVELLAFMNKYEQKRFAMLRKYPRVPCHITMDMAADGRAFNCFAIDISAGGVSDTQPVMLHSNDTPIDFQGQLTVGQ
jgi:hypothetical protein